MEPRVDSTAPVYTVIIHVYIRVPPRAPRASLLDEDGRGLVVDHVPPPVSSLENVERLQGRGFFTSGFTARDPRDVASKDDLLARRPQRRHSVGTEQGSPGIYDVLGPLYGRMAGVDARPTTNDRIESRATPTGLVSKDTHPLRWTLCKTRLPSRTKDRASSSDPTL